MDLDTVIKVFQVAILPIGLAVYHAFQRMNKQSADHAAALASFKLHCAETYSTKSEMSESIKELRRSLDAVFAKLERIEDKLDGKQDKV